MKKTIGIIAAVLFVAVTAASAQSPTSDSTKNTRQTEKSSKSSDKMSKDKESQEQGSNQNNDRTLIHTADVPATLRQSLHSSDYNGWESGQVYKTKNGYSVEIRKNGMIKTHRFDASGKPIKD